MSALKEIGGLAIPWTDAVPPEDETNMFPYTKQIRQTRTLPAGWQFNKKKRALPSELYFDENISFKLRDKTTVTRSAQCTRILGD